mgnify:CR=1 FL=1
MKKKVVLAYSGGLDTSVILKWLQIEKKLDVIAFIADIGQKDELKTAKKNAVRMGAKKVIVADLKNIFAKDFIYPMFRANTLYEGNYLLGTAIARPLIAKKQIEIAKKYKADYVSHGATGKGNDQVRFELSCYALNPNIKIISPWREWDLNSRSKLLEFAEKNQIPISKDKKGEAPFSVDANILHTSSEGKILEDPSEIAPEYVFQRTCSPEEAPEKAAFVKIRFKNGDMIAIDDEKLEEHDLLEKLNQIGGNHGIGRLDLVEGRFIGMKSRGVYETPGGTILLEAHRAIESVTLDKKTAHDKERVMPEYAELVYNGYWFSKKRIKLQKIIDKKRNQVSGEITLSLYKGNITILSRKTKNKAYSMKKVSFEENKTFNKKKVENFIKFHSKQLNKG